MAESQKNKACIFNFNWYIMVNKDTNRCKLIYIKKEGKSGIYNDSELGIYLQHIKSVNLVEYLGDLTDLDFCKFVCIELEDESKVFASLLQYDDRKVDDDSHLYKEEILNFKYV